MVNPKGKYRVYKNESEKNDWVLPKLNGSEHESSEDGILEDKFNKIIFIQ